jgi:hypothetical protein
MILTCLGLPYIAWPDAGDPHGPLVYGRFHDDWDVLDLSAVADAVWEGAE